MLSKRCRSAILVMLDVARLARGGPVPARALRAADGLAPRQFEFVLQALVRGGLLRSLRGPGGGYELARERRRITLGDIVRVVMDPPDGGQAASPDNDVAQSAIQAAGEAFLSTLNTVTLSDCLQGDGAVTTPDERRADFHI